VGGGKHERQWSDASSQSQTSNISQTTSALLAELDAYPDAPDDNNRTSFTKALQGMGMGRLLSRRKSSTPTVEHRRKSSDPILLTGGPVSAGLSPGGKSGKGGNGLGHIPEGSESTISMDEIQEMQERGGLTNKGLREAASLVARNGMLERRDAKIVPGQGQEQAQEQGLDLLGDVDLGPR
jgi:hypothetical protein